MGSLGINSIDGDVCPYRGLTAGEQTQGMAMDVYLPKRRVQAMERPFIVTGAAVLLNT